VTDAGPARLRNYLAGVYATGAMALAAVVASAHLGLPDRFELLLFVTGVLLFVGELCPIRLWRQGSINEYTFSGTFALALLITGPLVYVVAAQLCALLIDEFRHRKPIRVIAFNVGQYTLTLVLARAAVCQIEGVGFGDFGGASRPRELLAIGAAGLVFFLVNAVLTGTVLGLVGGKALTPFVLRYLRDEFPVTPIVLGLAPVVLACMEFSVWTVPLSLLPIIAVRRATESAGEHEIASLHDPLTGLPNRSLLLIRLGQALQAAGEQRGELALLMLDLDHFKEINDTLGHHVGDELLRMVGERLSSAVRPGDTVARLGGDEFAVVVRGADAHDGANVAQRLAATLSEAFALVAVSLNVEASVGVSLYPDHGGDAEALIRHADVALYNAKKRRGTFVIYDPCSDEHTIERLALMGELRQGIERDELVVHYQPKVSTATGRVVSVEALVRWDHPARGLLMPARFIPAAENTGLIVPLTQRVVDSALRAVRAWRAGGLAVRVAVNVTARHIANLDLPNQIDAALTAHGLPGDVLILEVTESCLMSDPSRTKTVLNRLHAMGVGLSIDDFGTGYSSFAHLRDLAVDEIKIDRSFVAGSANSTANAAIVKSAIDLGHNLGLEVVAEGVESEACLTILTAMGCDVVQGYHLGRPMPADDLLAWATLRHGAADKAVTVSAAC
jgi:diguanylate cyclase (GGDEF)-like protein